MDYDELMKAYKELEIKYNNATLELNVLKKLIFGSKREKTPKDSPIAINQCSLFDNEKDIEENVQKQITEQVEEITVYKKKKSKKRVAGIKKNILNGVVVRKQEYVLNEDEKCPTCDSDLKLVGKEVVRTEIEYIPPKLEIVEYIKNIYKCTECGTEESEKETPTFVKSEVPKPVLAHSFVSPSLAAEVFYQKYCLGVPFYRQEKMWDDRRISSSKKYDGKLEY